MKTVKQLLCAVIALMLAMAPMMATAETIYAGKVTKNSVVYNNKFKASGALSKGTYVVYKHAEQKNVYYVLATDGTRGYTHAGNIAKKGSIDTNEIALAKHTLNVYRIKDGKPYVVSQVAKGYPMVVLKVMRGIAQVKTLRGDVGYVKVSDLKHL